MGGDGKRTVNNDLMFRTEQSHIQNERFTAPKIINSEKFKITAWFSNGILIIPSV